MGRDANFLHHVRNGDPAIHLGREQMPDATPENRGVKIEQLDERGIVASASAVE